MDECLSQTEKIKHALNLRLLSSLIQRIQSAVNFPVLFSREYTVFNAQQVKKIGFKVQPCFVAGFLRKFF